MMGDPPDENGAESRTEPRRRVLLSGKLVYGDAEMTIDCAISDLSSKGARVRLAGPELLKEPIYLINVPHGLAFKAREAWRRGNLVGLTFTESYDLHTPPAELPKLVRRIWVEQTRQSN